MNQEVFFIIFIFFPFIALGIILISFQKKFFSLYKIEVNSQDPIDNEGLFLLLKNDPKKAKIFISKHGYEFIFSRWMLFFKKYKNARLNRLALMI